MQVGDRKVRIGVGLGTATTSDPGRFAALVDGLESLGFDSLWLAERVSAESPDPFTALAFAAGRTDRLKFGTGVTVLPGRNPMLLAAQVGTLDALSNGRFLPAFGLGVARKVEQQAFGVTKDDRAARFDETFGLLRRFLEGETVDHKGRFFRFEGAQARPLPVQKPLDLWIGGSSPSELERCGRLADGWLPAFTPPEDVKKGIEAIEKAADKAGRTIDPEHYGALVPYVDGDVPEPLAAIAQRRRPGGDVHDVIAKGLDGLPALIERFIAAGASKFVVVPVVEPSNWDSHVSDLADAVHPLET
jgi:probable F420-dependent oxidoreductase